MATGTAPAEELWPPSRLFWRLPPPLLSRARPLPRAAPIVRPYSHERTIKMPLWLDSGRVMDSAKAFPPVPPKATGERLLCASYGEYLDDEVRRQFLVGREIDGVCPVGR